MFPRSFSAGAGRVLDPFASSWYVGSFPELFGFAIAGGWRHHAMSRSTSRTKSAELQAVALPAAASVDTRRMRYTPCSRNMRVGALARPPSRMFGFLIAALAVYALLVVVFLPYGIDDSFISLTYARNLAAGKGLVFQETDGPVEGYSNFLWVVLVAPLSLLDLDLYVAAKLLSAALGAGCVLLLWRFAHRWNEPGSWWSALPAGLLAVSPVHTLWSAVAMETPLVTLLLIAFVHRLACERDDVFPWSSVLAAFLALARPEGAMYGMLGFVYRVLSGKHGHVRWLAPFVAICGAYTVFRLHYFGRLLPAPFYAKTAAVGTAKLAEVRTGAMYLLRFLKEQWYPALFALSILPLVHAGERPVAVLLWMIIGGQVAFAVAVGGDWMPNHRFLAPVLPFVLLLQQRGLVHLAASVRRSPVIRSVSRWPLAGLLIAILYVPCIVSQTPGRSVTVRYMAAQARLAGHGFLTYPLSWVGTAMGSLSPFQQILEHLDDAGGQGSTVATQIVGYFAYEARGRYRILDTAGITNVRIAQLIHDRAPPVEQARFVLSRRPEYLWLTARAPTLDPFRAQYDIDGAIVKTQLFKTEYRHLATYGIRGHYQFLFGRIRPVRRPDGTSGSSQE